MDRHAFGQRGYILEHPALKIVIAGTVGAAHAEKIAYCIETARKIGVPLIGLYDSAGARIQEGLDVTRAIGKIFYQNSITSGAVPQISAIMGPCAGGAVYSPAITDFILMVKSTAYMFVTGPDVIKTVTHEEVTKEKLGGADTHNQISGVAHFAADSDEDCNSRMVAMQSSSESAAKCATPEI